LVNRSARSKLIPPRVLHLDPGDVPEWRSGEGDRVRVVAGSLACAAVRQGRPRSVCAQ